MRKPTYTTTTMVHFTLYRRPESNKHGDERGRVWFHKYSQYDRMFFRAPKLIRTISFKLTEE